MYQRFNYLIQEVFMCGICGIIERNGASCGSKQVIQSMMDKLTHRGPDDNGYIVQDNVTFGFVRLSIIDLNSGMQPMFNEDESIVVICNGEIYNYKELRRGLIERGHHFKSQCDVEVIPHLYEEQGIDFVKSLNGQFAFALYDKKTKTLYCARDHVGIAPMFYAVHNNNFIFASEMKALMEYPGIEKKIDLTSLDQMISFPGILSPRTIFKGIHSLESGHFIKVTDQGIENYEYWDLDFSDEKEEHGEDYYIQNLNEVLTKAVEYRLNANVPVGFYVSGGLDSSIIASLIQRISSGVLRHSFSIDFAQKNISEKKFQYMILDQIKSIHHEAVFNIEDIIGNLKNAVYYSESVLKETYNTASFVLSKLVHDAGIKVVQTGEGADELFGGYVGYKFDKMRSIMGNTSGIDLTSEDKAINERLWGDPNFTYEKNHGAFKQMKYQLYSDNIKGEMSTFECTNEPVVRTDKLKGLDLLQRRSYLDFKMRLSDHLLSDHGDRMAYANSVEARYPFLDKNVIEFAARIPSEMKLKGYEEKYILKKMAEGIIPQKILKRPKFAFVAPGSADILKYQSEYITDMMSYDTIKKQGIFDADYVEDLKRQYMSPGFKLNLPYDSDMLIIVMTTSILMNTFNVNQI